MKFFVSYSRSVQEQVRAIIAALREEGEEIWWDQDLSAGQDWWATILDNIEQCQICLFFVSEKSVQSPYCMEELRYALARNRLVLPYVMDSVTYAIPSEIMKGRIQYELYEGTPDHIRERIRITCGGVKWDQYKDRYIARPPEPNTGTSDLVDRLDKAVSLANEGYFDEAIVGFKDVSNNDYTEYGAFCHEWIEKINRYRDIAKLADRPAMKKLAAPKWETFVQQYGDEFDPLEVRGKFVASGTLAGSRPKTAEDFLEQGKNRPAHEYDLKIVDYTEALRLNPQYSEAYNSRGNAYIDKRDFDKAIADYTEAIRLNPQYAAAYYNRANTYIDKGDFDKAIADYTEALRLNPQDAEAYYNRGNTYKNKGEIDKAIEDHTEAIRLNGQFTDAYNNRGSNYGNKGDYDRAIADYERALSIKPDHMAAEENLKKALRVRRAILNSAGIEITAEDYLEQGKNRPSHEYDLKIADYTEAIRLNPRLTEAYLRRAGNYNAQEDYDRALADYDAAIQLEPDNFIAYNGRGLIYASLMQHTRAIADYSEAIQLSPQFADVYYNRGLSYASIGNYDQAIADYTEAIRLNPQFANAYNNRGNNYKLRGDDYHSIADYDCAIADYEQALRLDPKHPIALTNLKKAQDARARQE